MDDDLDSENDEEEFRTFQFKIALVGESGVGKTSVASRLTQSIFQISSRETVGVEFYKKELVLPGNARVSLQVKMQMYQCKIWDIGGLSGSNKMFANYIFGSSAILLVYDVTVLEKSCGDRLPYTAVVANKSDLREHRAVCPALHNNFVKDNGLYSYSLSAKTGSRVVATFHRIAADLAGLSISNEYLKALAGMVEITMDEQVLSRPPDASGSQSAGTSASDIQHEDLVHFRLKIWSCKGLFGACGSRFTSWLKCLGRK